MLSTSFFLGSYSNQGTFLFSLLNAFVCLHVRVFRERERDLFFLRAQFLRCCVATLFFSLIFADGEQLERKKKGRRRQNGTMIYYVFFGYFTLEYSSNIHLKRERPRRALARVVSARLSEGGKGENHRSGKPLFFVRKGHSRVFG